MKKCFYAVIFVLLAFFITSCNEVGLGEEVDLEAPVLSVKSLKSGNTNLADFEGGVYSKKNVTFYGTATDNNKISKVYAEIKWSDENTFTYYDSAKLSGKDWEIQIEFEKEGAVFVRFLAEDPAGNYGTKSSKTVTLFVDESAPVANAWYIDREINGIQYNLKSKEKLQELDLSLAENKDAAQNVSFTLCANATDTFGIKAISVKIKDEDGNTVAEIENSKGNNYAPQFKVTQEILEQGKPSLKSGLHYLQVFYDSEDVITLPSSNSVQDVEVEMGWFIWWPEKDLPQISNADITEDSSTGELSLNAHVKDVLSFTFFDDDELSDGYFALLTSSELSNFTVNWEQIIQNPESIINAVKADETNGEATDEEARENRTAHFVSSGKTETSGESTGERETVIVLKAASESQTMTFLAVGFDNTALRKTVTKQISVRVTDESTPILLVSTPKNNSIPAFNADGSTTTVEGQTLDSAGCSYLEFVWVPNSFENKKEKALAWLETINTDDAHKKLLNVAGKVSSKDGMKLWAVELSEKTKNNGFYKQTFSFSQNLLEDFVYNGNNEKALSKYFLTKLTRNDGNVLYQEHFYEADTTPPQIIGVTPATDMQVVINQENLTLQFYAKKDSGLKIDEDSYKITRVDTSEPQVLSGRVNNTSGYYEATVTKEELDNFSSNGARPKYQFEAKDIFGNENKIQYTIVVSDLPALKAISTSAHTKCKKGDEIDIVASFSKTVGITGTPRIKLKGIKNSITGITANQAVYADYESGSGTTAIHFKYTVKEGDYSTGLTLFDSYPIDDNGTTSFVDSKVAILELGEGSLNAKNSVDSKNIQIDGISPSVTNVVVLQTGGEENSGTTYLSEGDTITVTVTLSEDVIVNSPMPSINLVANGSASSLINIPYTNTTNSGTNTQIIFSKTISSSDKNGALTYVPSSYIQNAESITDLYGNTLKIDSSTTAKDTKLYVDTVAPKTPVCSAVYGGSSVTLTDNAKFKDKVSFTLSKKEEDSTIKWIQYSVDGGSNWLPNNASAEGTAVELTDAASFTYRAVDYAGNVSDIPNPIYIDVESSFPAFTVECTNADGNYKVDSTLNFNVNFARPVNVAANSGAYIILSGNGSSDKGGGNATISNKAKQTGVYTVSFVYTVTSSDDFTLKVAQNAVTLTGITDEYGISKGSKTLAADYTRTGVHCDGIVPSVSSMTHQDDTTANTTDNVIVLNFNENVIKSSGFITLRRAGDWALPPVLSGTDFKKISNAVSEEQKNILSLQENDTDMEDSEWVNGSTADYENKYYHGTGQFVGPYKKTTQGITEAGEPDVETKYVLGFDMGIWETDTPHYYGKTFKSSTQTSPTTLDASNATTITANKIRDVLKAAGYDKRVVDVTSSNVKVDGKTVTITFPAGLCDKTASLPKGINWEIEVDDGTFIDESGNSMSSYTNEFVSSGVSTPVVRVDRYSYGLGIYQATSAGGKSIITGDSTVPTGYVRVRIDCETSDVTIKYANVASTVSSDSTTTPDTKGSTSTYYNYKAITKGTLKGSSLNQFYSSVLGVGDGEYNTAFRKYIVAQAEKSGQEPSELGYEGILQTVVEIVNPKQKSGYEIYQMTDAKYAKVSIRGTTSWSGEPSISPFPLRDAQIGSPFLRLCFREKHINSTSKKYYWVSYEVLVDTSYSGHARASSSWDYIGGWGYVSPGGLSTTSNMQTEH